jgi:hypothetical protein
MLCCQAARLVTVGQLASGAFASHHLFGYTMHEPVLFADPSGNRFIEKALLAKIVAAAAGTFAAFACQHIEDDLQRMTEKWDKQVSAGLMTQQRRDELLAFARATLRGMFCYPALFFAAVLFL